MDWRRLLSAKRLGQAEAVAPADHRSPYEIDVDRLVFSSAFRRLQNKMQVHGPSLESDSPGDYVRNRLTHSLEVSRVGRSLGQLAGQFIVRNFLAGSGFLATDIGHIVSAGAIAHDIGQTPFSHEGERAISSWWNKSPTAREILAGLPPALGWELTRFEGNAFGFRLLTRLEGWKKNGGLQFTLATLGAFSKYPWIGGLPPERRPHPDKYGAFASEEPFLAEVAMGTGLIPRGPGCWHRHPLAYLTEAADDICYRIVDVEDAVQMRVLSLAEAEALLGPLALPVASEYDALDGVERRVTYLRARAIGTLIKDAAAAFVDRHDALLAGEPVPPLLSLTERSDELAAVERVTRARIYRGDRRTETRLIAAVTMETLLENYGRALLEREHAGPGAELAGSAGALVDALAMQRAAPLPHDREGWVAALMDHIATMTDLRAVKEAKLLGASPTSLC